MLGGIHLAAFFIYFIFKLLLLLLLITIILLLSWWWSSGEKRKKLIKQTEIAKANSDLSMWAIKILNGSIRSLDILVVSYGGIAIRSATARDTFFFCCVIWKTLLYIYIPCLFSLDELCIFSLNIKDLAYTTHITGRSQFLNRISGTNNKKRLKAGQRLQRECAWVIGYNITQHKPNSTIVGWIMDGHGVFRTWTFCFIF